MDRSLLIKFEAIENSLHRLVTDLSQYPLGSICKKPEPDAWSVLEILQHLLIAEKGSFAYVKKKTSYPDSLEDASFYDDVRKLRLYIFLRIPIKVKAPAVVNEDHFNNAISYSDLLSEWKKHRSELKEFLNNVPNEWLNKLTYRHAFAGRMTLEGMLLFFRDHFVRHRKQIDRTLAKVQYE